MKRFICMMLTLIMLVSLVPAAAVTASAASYSTSEAAITVLKNMQPYTSRCYNVAGTNEFRIGYGTVCEKAHTKQEDGTYTQHTTNQETADKALRSVLTKLDKTVETFATNNGLSMKQYRHDALVVFSYLYGTAWMNGTGTVKTALKNGADVTELLNAVYGVTGNENRSKIIVNMYKNNVYTNDLPSSFSSVTYHANGGTMAQGDGSMYFMQFDASASAKHVPVPTKANHKFMGWYFGNGETFTSRSSSLNSSCKGKDLYALWQSTGTTSKNAENNPAVNFTLSKSQLASKTIYDLPTPNGSKSVGTVTGDVTITREYIRDDGSRWGMIGTGKWVKITAGSSSSGSGSSDNTKTTCVTVTNSYVNFRENPSVFGAKKGTFQQGEKLYIIKTKNADGFLWGEVAKSQYDPDYGIGWVALMYTNWNSVKDNPDNVVDTNPDKDKSDVIAKATITFNGYVNLRNGAGTQNRIVGSLAQDETVDIYEIKTVNGHQWGRISSGWFCMTYASVTMLSGSSDISNEGSKAYTFTGTAKEGIVTYVDATTNSNKTSTQPQAGKTVSIITLKMAHDETWAKIGWTVTEDKKTVNKYGWTQIESNKSSMFDFDVLSPKSYPVGLNTVKFQVVADTVTVRQEPGSGEKAITKLNKGYQFNVAAIKLVNEEIWGAVENIELNGGEDIDAGWVNLASKYVKRADLADKPSTPSTSTNLVATVVNTDKVNVRMDSKVTATKVGTLARGTVANVLKERDGWYKLDVDVDNDPETSSWVSGDYLDVRSGSSSNGNLNAPSSTGIGFVANTYAGVNVRTGAGTANASVGKLLPGTKVEILETKYVGSAKWGRMEKGWVCMDYISMVSEAPVEPETPKLPNGGTSIGSYDDAEKTTTTAVYTGNVYTSNIDTGAVIVWADTRHDSTDIVRELGDGQPVTIYELLTVEEKVETTDDDQSGNSSVTVVTSYWARVNDGYIRNPDKCIELNPLDEQTHTLTGSDTLRVRDKANGNEIGKIEKGDKVKVTSLQILKDKVWGKIEYKGDPGWIRLDYMSEGALYEEEKVETPVQPPKAPSIGDTGSTGNGGFVNNDGGYLYTGKIIHSDGVKIRATASTSASVTTTMNKGQSLVIYETTFSDNRAWGRCDAGWVYLYYVDMTPCKEGFVDARVVYQDNTMIYSDMEMTESVGTYARQSVIDIYEIVGKMARTELGWVSTDNLL